MSTSDDLSSNEEDVEKGTQFAPKEQASSESRQGESWLDIAYLIILLVLFLVATAVFWLLSGFNLISILISDEENSTADPNSSNTFYSRVKFVDAKTKKYGKRVKYIHGRIVVWVLTLLIVNFFVDPGLKYKSVLGSELWKWTLLAALILCGYSFISLASAKLIDLLCLISQFKRHRNAEYYATGLKRSVNLVLHSSSVLLAWIFYFKTSRGIRKTPDTEELLHVGTWTFVMLTVAAFLRLLKTVLLLMWEADVVYNRFRGRILSIRLHQFFLGHLCGYEDKRRLDIFRPEVPSFFSNDGKRASDKTQPTTANDNETQSTTMNEETQTPTETTMNGTQAPTETTMDETQAPTDHSERDDDIDNNRDHNERDTTTTTESDERKQTTMNNKKEPTTFQIQRMAKYFVSLSNASSRDDDGTSQVLDKCKDYKKRINNNDVRASELSEVLKLEVKYAELLLSDLKREHQLVESGKLTYENWEMAMVKAQKNCLALGYSLSDAKDVVKVLNKVMTAVLVAIVIIAWLLLTDIATNKILVLIASPFLAATFIFGEACKKIFEGIVFSFINHPFNVGDLCIIDNKELEVKCMGILTTKFILIGKKEEVLYPNSMLATTSIINLKEEPNTNDRVELKLPYCITTAKYNSLEDQIKNFLKVNTGSEDAFTVTLEDIGDGTKILIKYRLQMSIKSATHSQCLEKKREHKSALLKKIVECLEMKDDAHPVQPDSLTTKRLHS